MNQMTKYTFEQFGATRVYTGTIAYSPDGMQIAHIVNTTGQFNLWTVPSGGGAPRQITAFMENTVRSFAWSPDGTQFVLMADTEGNEHHQLYFVPSRGGWPRAITNRPDVPYEISTASWSPDGRHILYDGNDRQPSDVDIYLYDVASGSSTCVMPSGRIYAPIAWSRDSTHLTVIDVRSNTDVSIWVLNVATGQSFEATPHAGEVQFIAGPWAHDNSGFYVISNLDHEFIGLAFYDLASKELKWLETPDHDIEGVSLSLDGRTLIWIANEDGVSKIHGRDLTTGQVLTLPALPIGVISGLDLAPDGTRAAFAFGQPGEASNLYELDLQSGRLTSLGQSMLGGIDPADMITPELIHYSSADGRMIPAWLYKPKGSGKFPMIVSIHGGPEAQERPVYGYRGFYQYMLNQGVAILAPNVRGSTGYGKSYQTLIHRDWGGAELKDIECAAQYLRGLDWVDSTRMAVFGGSFGGFATLSSLTRLPEYWAVGVDWVGPANLITFVKSVPPFWTRFMKAWVGDPEEDRAMLVERSPITYVNQIRCPLLIIQGANDPRVVKAESDQMVEQLHARGIDVTYYVDEHAGHGPTRNEGYLKWVKMTVEYLEKYLLAPTE
jgi:dipeptidyl aminopeptidase/acylaminoacyl peptidase